MHRHGMPNEKANDFFKSLKRLFSSMKKWRILVIIAVILAGTSSILSLVSPNKLKDITNIITKGITPNMDNLTEISNIVMNNLSSEELLASKIDSIFKSDKISDLDKQNFKEKIESLKSLDKEKQMEYMMSIPDSIMLNLLDDIKIDNTLVKKEDLLKTFNILKNIDRNDTKNLLSKLEELPDSVYKLVEPKMDMTKIKEISLFLLILYIIGALFGYRTFYIKYSFK